MTHGYSEAGYGPEAFDLEDAYDESYFDEGVEDDGWNEDFAEDDYDDEDYDDDDDGFGEDDDWDDGDDFAEDMAGLEYDDDDPEFIGSIVRRIRNRRKRRRGRRRVRTARGRGYVRAGRLRGYATRTEMKKALSRVGRDVRRNGGSIKRNASAIASNRSRIGTVMRVNKVQTKAIEKLRSDMQSQAQTQLLFSLLDSGTKTYELDGAFGGEADGTEIKLKDKSDSLTKLLPIFMTGGFGGSGKSGGMGFDNPMMMILMLDAIKGDD